jgi:hypothetical protein
MCPKTKLFGFKMYRPPISMRPINKNLNSTNLLLEASVVTRRRNTTLHHNFLHLPLVSFGHTAHNLQSTKKENGPIYQVSTWTQWKARAIRSFSLFYVYFQQQLSVANVSIARLIWFNNYIVFVCRCSGAIASIFLFGGYTKKKLKVISTTTIKLDIEIETIYSRKHKTDRSLLHHHYVPSAGN